MKVIRPLCSPCSTSPSPLLPGEGQSSDFPNPLLAGEGIKGYHRAGEVRIVPDRLKYFSRQLRKKQTSYETILWSHLRGRKFNNLKFRRQHPIGHYIVDFCCLEKWLIIELDGGQHNKEENIKKDEDRDHALSLMGYTILRLWNNELTESIDGTLQIIAELCGLT